MQRHVAGDADDAEWWQATYETRVRWGMPASLIFAAIVLIGASAALLAGLV